MVYAKCHRVPYESGLGYILLSRLYLSALVCYVFYFVARGRARVQVGGILISRRLHLFFPRNSWIICDESRVLFGI